MRVSIVSVSPGTPDPDYLTQARSHKTGKWLDITPATPFEGEETPNNAKAYMLKLKSDPVVLACIGKENGLFDSLVIRLLYGNEPDWLTDYSDKYVLRGGKRVSNGKVKPHKLVGVLHIPSGKLVPEPVVSVPYADDPTMTYTANMMQNGHLRWAKVGELGQDRWFIPHPLTLVDGEEGPLSLLGYVPQSHTLDHGVYMSLTTVTNAEWNHFVKGTGFERGGVLDVRSEDPELPVVSVNWYDSRRWAYTFGCTLPTMEEWTFAAISDENRTYPWGNNAPTHDICCFWSNEHKTSGPVPVYSMPGGSGKYGHQHLAGNVWCWTNTKKT